MRKNTKKIMDIIFLLLEEIIFKQDFEKEECKEMLNREFGNKIGPLSQRKD